MRARARRAREEERGSDARQQRSERAQTVRYIKKEAKRVAHETRANARAREKDAAQRDALFIWRYAYEARDKRREKRYMMRAMPR